MSTIKPRIIFINSGHYVFCDTECDNCPIKFVCLTSDSIAFDVKINKRTKKLVTAAPYYVAPPSV